MRPPVRHAVNAAHAALFGLRRRLGPALIGACIAVRGRWPAPAAPLENAGRLALSLYILHVVAGMGLLAAIDAVETATLPLVVVWSAGFYAAAVAAAWGWTRRFEHGPLEALMRRVGT